MSEAAILHETMLALSDAGCTVFRANVGLFFTRDGRPLKTGLPVGFADLFGHRPDGRAFYVEIKSETGRVRPQQWQFLKAMRARGAIALVARSAAEAVAAVLHNPE